MGIGIGTIVLLFFFVGLVLLQGFLRSLVARGITALAENLACGDSGKIEAFEDLIRFSFLAVIFAILVFFVFKENAALSWSAVILVLLLYVCFAYGSLDDQAVMPLYMVVFCSCILACLLLVNIIVRLHHQPSFLSFYCSPEGRNATLESAGIVLLLLLMIWAFQRIAGRGK